MCRVLLEHWITVPSCLLLGQASFSGFRHGTRCVALRSLCQELFKPASPPCLPSVPRVQGLRLLNSYSVSRRTQERNSCLQPRPAQSRDKPGLADAKLLASMLLVPVLCTYVHTVLYSCRPAPRKGHHGLLRCMYDNGQNARMSFAR